LSVTKLAILTEFVGSSGFATLCCSHSRVAVFCGAMAPKVNGPCPCGSGKKYKKCCGGSQSKNAPGSASAATMPSLGDELRRFTQTGDWCYLRNALAYTDNIHDQNLVSALAMDEAYGMNMPSDIKELLMQRFSSWTSAGHTPDGKVLFNHMRYFAADSKRAAPPIGTDVFLQGLGDVPVSDSTSTVPASDSTSTVSGAMLNGKKGVVIEQKTPAGQCAVRLYDEGRVVIVKYGNVTKQEPEVYRQFGDSGSSSSASSGAYNAFSNLLPDKPKQ